MPRIAIVIPTFNRCIHLKELLNLLNDQSDIRSELKKIVVVDGSSDGTLEMLSGQFPEVTIVEGNGNWWFTKSLNEGCKKAMELKADYILSLNDDTLIDPRFISMLEHHLDDTKENAIIGCLSLTDSAPHRVTFSGIKKLRGWRLKKIPYIQKYSITDLNTLEGLHPSPILLTRGLLVPAKILKELNYFDELFPQYGSDEDFALRAQKAGYGSFISWDARVYEKTYLTDKNSPLRHPSLWKFTRSFFDKHSKSSLRKHFYFYRRHASPLLFPFIIPLALLGNYYSYFKES